MNSQVKKLPDYREIARSCQKNKVSVTKEEIEESLLWLQRSRAKFIFKPAPCQVGDLVEIEYWSSQLNNGEKIKDSFILGQGHFLPGFEENLIGLETGTEKEFSFTFPTDFFQRDLAGKKIVFKVRMISVQKMELPEIDDRFAQGLGRFESLNSLRESIREGIILEKEIIERERLRAEILRKISQEAEFEISLDLIEAEKKNLLEELKERVAKDLKISFTEYLNRVQKTKEDILESFHPLAKERIKNTLILKEIAQREHVEVSEEEVKEEINKILRNSLNIEAVKSLDLDYLKRYIKEVIVKEKTLQFLESLAKI